MRKEADKKGQASIISVVLLILVVIATAVIVISFVIPFVRDKLSSGDCLDVTGPDKMGISSSVYTCYDSVSRKMHVQVEIGAIRNLIDGFAIELGGVASKSFKLLNGTTVTNVTMHDDTVTIKIPGDNAGTTYFFANIQTKPDSINVYPILENGKTCPVSDTVTTVEGCS